MAASFQIYPLEGSFSLIHIPLSLYHVFFQPILRVLLPNGGLETLEESVEGLGVDNKHGFLNVSITPVECSVVCHEYWARKIFEPFLSKLPKDTSKTVTISSDSYLIISVISGGVDAGRRVLELTSPLAYAGISIFFISTYYSDFIIVPSKDREKVFQALQARGFTFSEGVAGFAAPSGHSRGSSITSQLQPPSTPPPSNAAELQTRTFELLKKRKVVPYIEKDLNLVMCAAKDSNSSRMANAYSRPSVTRRGTGNGGLHRSWLDNIDTKLYTGLTSVLASQPKFLSITLAQEDPLSLVLDKCDLHVFGDSLNSGDTGCDLVPIFLDLESLPLQSSGIVSGVAGKLVAEMQSDLSDNSELSYLSTARAGAVILSAEHSKRALEVMQPLLSD